MDFDQLPRLHDSTGARIACGQISLDAMTPTTTQLIDAAWWAVGPVGPVGPVGYGWIWGVPTHGWFISWKIRKYENWGYPPWIGHLHSVLLQSWTSKIPKEIKKWWYCFFTAWKIGILTYPCHCCPKKLAVKIYVFIGSFFNPYVLYNMYLQDWELPEKNRDFSAENLGFNLLIWCLLGVWCPLGVFHNPVMKMVWWWWITLKDIRSLSYSDDLAMISSFCCHDSCVLHNVHRFFWKPKWWEQSSQLAFLWD